MPSIFLRQLLQRLLLAWIISTTAIATHRTGAIDKRHPSLDAQLSGLNISDRIEVERLISLWGNPIQSALESQQRLRHHDRTPHPRALGELRELFSRQVKCGSGTCKSGYCCVANKEGCCPGRCCPNGVSVARCSYPIGPGDEPDLELTTIYPVL